jgi:archaemetzincin
VEPAILEWLAARLEERLPARCHIGAPWALRGEWLDAGRAQYRSNVIVDALVDSEPEGWLLALTGADLYAPGRTFIFGEATLGGCCALVSLARLGEEGREHLPQRLLLEALHELGHVAGLVHCPVEGCIMASAETVLDIDARGSEFCVQCAAAWRLSGQNRKG